MQEINLLFKDRIMRQFKTSEEMSTLKKFGITVVSGGLGSAQHFNKFKLLSTVRINSRSKCQKFDQNKKFDQNFVKFLEPNFSCGSNGLFFVQFRFGSHKNGGRYE